MAEDLRFQFKLSWGRILDSSSSFLGGGCRERATSAGVGKAKRERGETSKDCSMSKKSMFSPRRLHSQSSTGRRTRWSWRRGRRKKTSIPLSPLSSLSTSHQTLTSKCFILTSPQSLGAKNGCGFGSGSKSRPARGGSRDPHPPLLLPLHPLLQ